MKLTTLLRPLACSLLLAAACGGSENPATTAGTGGGHTGGGNTGAGGGGSKPLSVTWEDCNLFTDGPTFPARCAKVETPLRWSDPQGKTISVFVKKLPASKPRRGSVWLLDGGPGAGGVGLEGFAQFLDKNDGTLDIYIPHHRGTGQSTKLRCPGDAADSEKGLEITGDEWPACIDALKAEWGDGLGAFSTTEAARDLGGLIDAEKQDGDQVFVLGTSYGTYLANRYLRIFPEQATAAVLGSICPPDACHLDQFDVLYDQVGAQFLDMCGKDATCSSYLGPDPRKRLLDLYASLDNGHCPALADLGVDRELLRVILGEILNDWNGRLAIAPIIHRLERCDQADIDAFVHFVGVVFGAPDAPPDPMLSAWSFPLGNNITFSEMWTDPPPTASALIAASEATAISKGISLGDASVFPLWPRYPRDEYFGQWGDNNLPMLMLNGDLDPATPIWIASAAAEHFKGPNQTFVTLPRAPHNAIGASPISADGTSCGAELVLAFLADPTAPLDTSCKDQILPVKFAGASWLAQKFFGTDDMFDNP
ncbi:MAG: alpha/beta fold hydrolase [Minicystis sp.]